MFWWHDKNRQCWKPLKYRLPLIKLPWTRNVSWSLCAPCNNSFSRSCVVVDVVVKYLYTPQLLLRKGMRASKKCIMYPNTYTNLHQRLVFIQEVICINYLVCTPNLRHFISLHQVIKPPADILGSSGYSLTQTCHLCSRTNRGILI